MKWFRLWTDILDDVKMLQLSDYEFRIWIYLMCYLSNINSTSGHFQITFKLLSLHFHLRFNLFSRAVETFQRLGLITIDENGIGTITNWNKRQYKSDDVYARVKKHREVIAKRNVSCNDIETPPDTDTDTEKNIKKKGFSIPSINEVCDYCQELNNGVDPQKWHDFYSSKGWMIGKNKMKDWRAAVRTWGKGDATKPVKAGWL